MALVEQRGVVSIQKLIRFVILISVLLFGAGVVIGHKAQSQSRTGSRTQPKVDFHVTPFAAEAKDVSGSDDGRPPEVVFETLARRSDGSYVRTFTTKSPTGEPGTAIEILDTRKRSFSNLEPYTKLATTYHYPTEADKEMRRQVDYWGICDDFQNMQGKGSKENADSLLGYPVLKVLSTTARGTVTFMVAPALDCYTLRQTSTTPWGYTDFVVTKITEGEPPGSLFAMPSGYAEASPSQVEAAWKLKYPGRVLREDARIKKLEGLYNRSQ